MLDDVVPYVGQPVVFNRPDGTIAATIMTDANGYAEAALDAGGTVTGVVPSQHWRESVFDVQPGDDIRLWIPSNPASAGSFTIGFAPFPSADHYVLGLPCSRSIDGANTIAVMPPSTTIVVPGGCQKSAALLTIAALSSTNVLLATVAASNVPFVAGGSVTVSQPWRSPADMTFGYVNLDGTVREIETSRGTPLATSIGTVLFPQGSTAQAVVANAPTTTAMNVSFFIEEPAAARCGQSIYTVDADAGPRTIDFAALRLPWLEPTTYDVATRTFTMPTPHPADLFRIDLLYNTNDEIWDVDLPSTASSFTLPVLPDTLTLSEPPFYFYANLIESSAVAGYAAARQDPDAVLDLHPGVTLRTSTCNW